MPIHKQDDCEYTFLIADLMTTLSFADKFVCKIWTGGKELPFIFDDEHTMLFLQEGIRASKGNRINYVLYDTIDNVQIFIDENREDVL